jgi:hypothetical protein
MTMRRIWLPDHRGRNAVVLLVPRQHAAEAVPLDPSSRPVRFTRRIKATETSASPALRRRFPDPETLARALVQGDPEVDFEAAGRETGPCDRVYIDSRGKPTYSARLVEVVCDRKGAEVERREPQLVPANLVPDTPPVWSGRLLRRHLAARRFAFTRAYQVRHGNALEYDFLYGLAAHLQERNCVALIGSGPKGIGPLVPEANAPPMKGILEGRTRGAQYLLILHLAAFELRHPEGDPCPD